ncbi:hypothetical protein M3I01_008655 [Marinomonas sp. RSW2]|uniref:Immunity protein 49 of polymorphic toxin system n=1 Tax=Marinomonas maritima TaxID=2940935 RepID=A0ABT5WDW8_9GAMM|nr:hypothetical protein [Marinomonas maritima]MDE8602993.1 hypothetical protein [Marinomonas maritima]
MFDRSIDENLNRYIEEAIFFFKNSESDYSFVIENNHGEKSDDLFLSRRSYLVYQTQLYRYASGDDFDFWWKCFSIFSKVNKTFIYKLMWLKNNVNKYNRWGEFYNKFKISRDIPLLSYIVACDPNLSDREIHANNFLSELIENRKYFNGDTQKDFVRAMLYDLKDLNFDSNGLYFEQCEYYFNKHLTSPEYIEILECRGMNNEANIEVVDLSAKLKNALNDEVPDNEIFDKKYMSELFERINMIFKGQLDSLGIACSSLSEAKESKKMFCLYWLYPDFFQVKQPVTYLIAVSS